MKFEKPFTLKEIASFINAEFVGDPGHIVSGLNEIHRVEPGDLTFCDYHKYYNKSLNSAASTVIINTKIEAPKGKALIFSDDPFRDYVALVKRFRPFEPCNKAISDTALIGSGTVIQPGAFVGNHVSIGKNCIIHSNVSIYDHTVIGDNVIVHANSVIGADAYYFKKRPQGFDKLESCGRTVLEDNVEIGALCTIDRGVSGDTIIGKGTKLDNHIQIGHDTVVGKNCLIGDHVAIAGVANIEDEVMIWGSCSINKDLVIGKGAIVLACSGVDKSLEGGKTYYGMPAEDARKKWKEVALLKKLPEMWEKLNS